LSTHGFTLSHISACPLVNTWINPVTYFCPPILTLQTITSHLNTTITSDLNTLKKKKTTTFEFENPCVDKGTGRNM
jgi:hypothetical protein